MKARHRHPRPQSPKLEQPNTENAEKAEASKSSARKANNTTNQVSTLNPIYEYSEEVNAIAERDFQMRRDVLVDACQKWKLNGRYPPNAWEFFISAGHGLAWCNVFKAASSTWLYYFNVLGNCETLTVAI